MTENDRFEEFMDRWAREYNRPPETPREEIWEGIRAAIGAEAPGTEVVPLPDGRRQEWGPSLPRWWPVAVGAAALLVVGIGVGRMTAPGAPAGEAPLEAGPAMGSTSFRTAALSHFSLTESFLTLVQGDARAGRVEPELGPWAMGLLAETRLLLDSPAAEDPGVKILLEDLEVILVQVVGLEAQDDPGGARARRELELLAAGMDDQQVLPRLQAMLPENPVSLGL